MKALTIIMVVAALLAAVPLADAARTVAINTYVTGSTSTDSTLTGLASLRISTIIIYTPDGDINVIMKGTSRSGNEGLRAQLPASSVGHKFDIELDELTIDKLSAQQVSIIAFR